MKKDIVKNKKTNNKKIILEIVLIPLCVFYLIYTLLQNHPKISFIICSILVVITCIVFTVKYLKEVYIYKYKYNWFKVLISIFSIILIIVTLINLFYKLEILFVIMTGLLLCFLLAFSTQKIIFILKKEKNLSQNIIHSFLSLVSFMIIFSTFLINLF